jgi:hypothetical protein
MRNGTWVFGLLTLGFASEARADQAPPAHVGFQMALRTGYSLPMGKVSGADGADMSEFYSGQVPILLEIGGKVIPELFVAGYLGFGFGGVSGNQENLCEAARADCAAASFRFGAEVQYHILPASLSNPWLGYGIGISSAAITISEGGEEGSISQAGWEYAHFMGGVDFRLSRGFGLGPYVDFAIGEYMRYSVDSPAGFEEDGDIDSTDIHQWLTFGVRGVLFP